MKVHIADLQGNDVVNGEGVCVSLWTQGCPHRCFQCHNPTTWDFNGGYEIEEDKLINQILNLINDNGVQRNFSVLGGEPLCYQNIGYVTRVLREVKNKYPTIKTFVWTGFTIEELIDDKNITILDYIDVLIDGRYIAEERDLTLPLRGSRNQRILRKGIDFKKNNKGEQNLDKHKNL